MTLWSPPQGISPILPASASLVERQTRPVCLPLLKGRAGGPVRGGRLGSGSNDPYAYAYMGGC